jgi:serine protease
MNTRIILLLVCLFLLNGILPAQVRMTGEAIVQLHSGHDIATFVSDMNAQLGLTAEVKESRCIYPRMNLWLVAFNEENIPLRDFLYHAKMNAAVAQAQVNHIVAQRLVPDDPFFEQQWHHQQANDHDIDSELAWDITTGGSTPSGDEIVVCVVELGGAQWNTTDIADNHWVNVQEIPLNNIDDDNNGFIDDYHGWNIVSESDVLGNDSHGTRVCSMIGSKGNNNTGVVGVNWDVKMMMVQIGSSTEAAAIEGYVYPLEMRRLYNESNGAQGAYVVATNSSWGTDNGQPTDAPIWCAMYDSLGVHGVLSCASTTNNNMNVDAFGDLPTACPSNYLISVGRTNSMDVRASGGYGITTIDLAAPGDAVYLANNTTYTTTTGTSFSSPCVAGAIALLYSAPCTAFDDNADTNPSQAAIIMKDYILNGVDTTTQLLGETVSGGRLNVNNSLQLLINSCDNGQCMAPYGLEVSQTPGTLNYSISWNDLIAAEDYRLEYRPSGNPSWTSVELNNGNETILENLLACTQYEARVAGYCTDSLSTWSQIIEWETDGCCIQPQTLSVIASTANTLTLQWNEVLAATGYTIIAADVNGNTQQWLTAEIDTFTVTDLAPCSNYTISISSSCNNPEGPAIEVPAFTPGCEDCALIPYCVTTANSDVEFIQYVEVGNIVHTSTDDNGYVLVTDVTDTLYATSTYTIECAPGYIGTTYNENFRVWIDYNIDGDFEDENELVFDPSPTTIPVNGSFTIPNSVTEGVSRMRVSMTYTPINANNEPSPCGNLTYGEIEDYCVTLTNAVSVKESSAKTVILLPNPATDWLEIRGLSNAPASIEIRSVDGRLYTSLTANEWPRIALPALPNGTYLVRMESESSVVVSPLVIVR